MQNRIENALVNAVARAEHGAPPRLGSALSYAVFPGGARVRPLLCLAVAEANGEAASPLAEAAAAALELLHCASLVHDDLPCFDDASERRGKPSVHRVFGEAIAVLAGDALIVSAFETLALAGMTAPHRLPALVALMARAAGSPSGLVAGQAWESEPSVPVAEYHRAKTGSLFVAATMAGAVVAGRDPLPWRAMGEKLGEAYQVADDLLDALAEGSEGGKPARQDEKLGRPSAVAALGVDGAVAHLRALVAGAADAVPECKGAATLRGLALQMAERLVPVRFKQSAA